MTLQVEKRVQEFYDQSPEEVIHPIFSKYRGFLEKELLVERLKHGIILDLGCGDGRLFETILSVHPKCALVATDLSKQQVRLSKRRLKNSLHENGIHLVVSNVRHLPFKENIFDGILCLGLFEYLHKLDEALLEIKRTLKNKGKVTMNFANKRNVLNVFGKLKRMYDSYLKNKSLIFPIDKACCDSTEIESILSRTGMKTNIYGYYVFLPLFNVLIQSFLRNIRFRTSFLYSLFLVEKVFCGFSISRFFGIYFIAECTK